VTSRLVFDDKERVGQWVAEQVEQKATWGSFYAMGVERKSDLIAGIVFHQFTDANAACHIAVAKPTKAFIELLHHAAHYAFNHCKLKRLTGMVTASNTKALQLDLHLGWEHEFSMRCAGMDGEDLHVLVLWPEKCRWLKGVDDVRIT